MMLANDLKTYYDEVRRYLDCPKDEQDRLLLSVNKQVIELQVDNPNLDYDGIVEFLGEPESLAASLMERLSPDVIQKFRKRKRHLRMSAIVCIAAIVIVLSTVLIYTTSIQFKSDLTEENTTIIDDGETFPEVEDTLVDTETLIKEISYNEPCQENAFCYIGFSYVPLRSPHFTCPSSNFFRNNVLCRRFRKRYYRRNNYRSSSYYIP